MIEHIKNPHTAIFIGQTGFEKTQLVLELLKKNTGNILTILLSFVQRSEKMKHVMLKSGPKTMTMFGL